MNLTFSRAAKPRQTSRESSSFHVNTNTNNSQKTQIKSQDSSNVWEIPATELWKHLGQNDYFLVFSKRFNMSRIFAKRNTTISQKKKS